MLKNFFNLFRTKKTDSVTEEEKEAFAKVIINEKNKLNPKPKKVKSLKSHKIDNFRYKIGDKVICRSNEPDPLFIGVITEFWNNEGKWKKALPVVLDKETNKSITFAGIMRPYSKELHNHLLKMKPLVQWNYLAPEEVRYTEKEIQLKEENHKKRILPFKK